MQAIQSQMQNVNGMPAQPGGAPPPNQGPGGQAVQIRRRRPRRLRLTSSTKAVCVTTTRPSTRLRLLNSATSSTITRKILWRATPSFISVRSLTSKASFPRRSSITMRFWNSSPGNPLAPAAELRKGQSLIQMGQKDAGVRELRTLIQRYPQTPEAAQGRSALNGMGVRIYAAKPSAYPAAPPAPQ